MTNEQCIEIAEKVWGWEKVIKPSFKYPFWKDENDDCWPDDYIYKQVNSWRGFGRTVEAMREKGWHFDIAFCSEAHGDCLGFERNEYYPIHWNSMEPQSLIEATHLAALEALNDKR